MIRLLRELRQRKVFRGAGYYLIAAWGMLQVGDVVVEPAGLPPWSMTALLYLLILGFPIAMVLSWRYDIGEHGIVRTRASHLQDTPPERLRGIDYLLLVALASIGGLGLYQLLPIAQQAEEARVAAPPGDLDGLSPNSIAVLPFSDISQSKDQEYLGDGISDTVMHVLSQIAELNVTARTSSFAFKDRNLPIPEIARALAVVHVLEGSIQKAGEQVRIIARLIDARRGTEVWSGYYDREIDSIFAIQDEIAREVATALTTEVLKTGDTSAIEERYRPSLDAYEKFILGKKELERRSAGGALAAIPLFEEAVALDPNYPLAHVFLARAIYQVGGMNERTESLERAGALVARALDLDPLLAEAHALKGDLLRAQKRPAEAEAAIKRALELRPSFASAYASYSILKYMQGDLDEALQLIRRAVELDPQEDRYRTQLAQALWFVSRAEEAIAITKEAIRRNPDVPTNYIQLGRWTTQMGDIGKGSYWERQAALADPVGGNLEMAECMTLVQLWAEEQARSCLENYLEEHPDDTEAWQYLAIVTGDLALGLSTLRAAVEKDPTFWYRRYQLSDWLVEAEKWQETIDVLRPVAPQLFSGEIQVDDFSTWAVRNLAQAYQGLGDDERATALLNAGLAYLERRRTLQGAGFISGIEDVQYLILLGRTDEAMDRLEAVVDAGWRFYSFALTTAFFDQVRDNPRFQEIVATVRADMKEQLAWYEEHKDDPIEQHGI